MVTNKNVTQKAARRKMNMLELAEEMGNVSKACKIMGYSRQQFYEIRRNYQTYGSKDYLINYLEQKIHIQTEFQKKLKKLSWIIL